MEASPRWSSDVNRAHVRRIEPFSFREIISQYYSGPKQVALAVCVWVNGDHARVCPRARAQCPCMCGAGRAILGRLSPKHILHQNGTHRGAASRLLLLPLRGSRRLHLLRRQLRVLLHEWRHEQVQALLHLGEVALLGDIGVLLHPLVPEPLLARRLDRLHLLHRAHRLLHQVAVVLDRPVALALKVEGGVHRHLLARGPAEGLRPAQLARVELVFERLVALAPAEPERLGIVPHKGDAVARVARTRAHIARLDAHGGTCPRELSLLSKR
mmetsp:Transcript_21486/g.68631  ORF Transcript_21486/g.68631 Transcript_21486/m.68631 type:complete len:270 (-) Transcript_21486:74-883(-)